MTAARFTGAFSEAQAVMASTSANTAPGLSGTSVTEPSIETTGSPRFLYLAGIPVLGNGARVLWIALRPAD
jgi:hypothetical protein